MKGDCYQANGNYLMNLLLTRADKGWTLCHGTVMGQGKIKGLRHGHCWLEKGDVVFDKSNSNDVAMRREEYYALGKIREIKRFSPDKVRKIILDTQHWGPWVGAK